MSNWTGQSEKWQTPKMFSFKSKSSDSSHYTFSFSFTCKVRQINVWTIDNVSTLSLLFHLGMHISRTQTINCTVIEYCTLFAVEWNGGEWGNGEGKRRNESYDKICEQKTPKCGKLLPFDNRIYRQFHVWRQWTTPMINRSMIGQCMTCESLTGIEMEIDHEDNYTTRSIFLQVSSTESP